MPGVVLWLKPAPFQMPPDGFGDVELGRIRRQKKQVQATGFPHCLPLLHAGRRMNTGVIEHHHGWSTGVPGQAVKLFHDDGGGDAARSRGPVALVVAAKKPPAVEAKPLLGRHEYVFAGELPAIGHVALAQHMGLVAVEQPQVASAAAAFEFAQPLVLGGVAYGVGPALCPAADAFVSATKAFKKARNGGLRLGCRWPAGLPTRSWPGRCASGWLLRPSARPLRPGQRPVAACVRVRAWFSSRQFLLAGRAWSNY